MTDVTKPSFHLDETSAGVEGPASTHEPETDLWNRHSGGPCPVAPGTEVLVKYRNGVQSDEILSKQRRWEAWPADIGDSDWDIVEWKLAPSTTLRAF